MYLVWVETIVRLLVVTSVPMIASIFCCLMALAAPAFDKESIDELLPPGLLPGGQDSWERQQGKRFDVDDKLPWHGYVYYADQPDMERARVFGHRAHNLAASGHFNEAFEQISEALKLDPSEFKSLLFRAKLSLRIGKKDQAKDDLRAAISLVCSDQGAEFECQKMLVGLGEYRLAADTIPQILPKLSHPFPEDAPAAFQYLLAYSQERLGEPTESIESYSKAARCFFTQRAYGAGCACLNNIHEIATRTGLPVQGIDDLEKIKAKMTGVSDLKAMVLQLVASRNCLDADFVEKITHCKLNELSKGAYYTGVLSKSLTEPPSSPLTGIDGAELCTGSSQLNMLRIYLVPEDCRLTLSDLNDILNGHKLVDGHERWSLRSDTTYACKVSSGTLYFSVLPEKYNSVVCITVVDHEPNEMVLTPAQIEQDRQNQRSGVGYNISTGKVEEALQATAEWVKGEPNNAYAKFKRSEALALAGRYEEAIKAIEFVIKYVETAKDDKYRFCDLNRGNDPLIKKGVYQTGLGKYADALDSFKKAFPEKLRSDDYFYRAQAEIGLGRQQEAVSDLQTAVEMYFNEARIVRRDEARNLLEETQNKKSNGKTLS